MQSQENQLAEMTVKAVVLGVVLSVILAAANAYLGLFAGMTVSASIPAAVVSMAVFRLFRHSTILECNLAKTAASAGESLAAGVIFTLPALVIMGSWAKFDFLQVTIIAAVGGSLGVLFTIPLRRSLIVEGKLKFPEGIATAEVLRTGQKGGSGVRDIAGAAAAGGLFKVGASALGFWPEIVEGAKALGGTIAYFGYNLSPALLSVGYIVGLNIAVLIFLGGLCNWVIAIPICAKLADWPTVNGQAIPALEWARQIWSAKTRYLGVGAMVIGGLWTIFHMRSSLVSGIRSGLKVYRDLAAGQTVARTDKDIPMKWTLVAIAVSVVPIFLVYQMFVQHVRISLLMALVMLVTGFVFSAVAGYMAGLVGSSNNPISGVTIATVLVSSLLLLALMGKGAPNGPAAAIIIGSVVCCAAAIAGDIMQDLKTGYIVEATPWKQQVAELLGTIAAAFVIAPVLMLLQKAYGFAGQASAGPRALASPQANLMASVSKGVFQGVLPWRYVFIGMLIAVGVITLDQLLARRGSSFRTPVLAVAIGFYLPFELSVPIFTGGLIHYAIGLYRRKNAVEPQAAEAAGSRGLLIASGLITGEALSGILVAVLIVLLAGKKTLPLLALPFGAVLGTVLLAAVAYWLFYAATAKPRD
jgi:putative OPT family oligopeptide transporter